MSKETIISIQNLHKSFTIGSASIDVLKSVNLTIQKGEMLGMVGASGVGKSTLLHIIGTLDRPTGGKVYFEDRDVFSLKNEKLAAFRNQEVGFVFQFNQLLSEFTALENTEIPAWIQRKNSKKTTERAHYLLQEVGLGDRVNHKPGELSGGEQQRVSIARALMNNPAVILADEPTGNLDTKTSEEIYTLLRRLNKEMVQTFVIVTHNDNLAKKMDRIIHIVDGKVIEE